MLDIWLSSGHKRRDAMSAHRGAASEASLGACLSLAALILQPGMEHRDVCQKEVLGPMILAAHRLGKQHVKQVPSTGDILNPRKVLHDLQRDTLHGNNQGAPKCAVNLGLITFGDISWDSQGNVAQTLEMELFDIADRFKEIEMNACVLLSVSAREGSSRDVETAVVWIPRASNSHSKVANRFLLYVYPGRAKVVKSVPELVKKLHEELSVINGCDAMYNVWTLMFNDRQSGEAPTELDGANTLLRSGIQSPKSSVIESKLSLYSQEPGIGKSIFTFERDLVDLEQKNPSLDTLCSCSNQTVCSQSSPNMTQKAADTSLCTSLRDSSRQSPVNPQKCIEQDQDSKAKRHQPRCGQVSLSYPDRRIFNAIETPKRIEGGSSGICKSADRPFQVRYPLPRRTLESLEPEQTESVYKSPHDEKKGENVPENRLQWQGEERNVRANAMASQKLSPRSGTESSIFSFSVKPSNQDLDCEGQPHPVSDTSFTTSVNVKSVESMAPNEHEPEKSDDPVRVNYNKGKKSMSLTEKSQEPCPIRAQKPLRSARDNYKSKLGARVWWELEYQARKIQSQLSEKSTGSYSGQLSHQKPLPMAFISSMAANREIAQDKILNQRQSDIQIPSAVLITVEETEGDRDSVLATEICEDSRSTSINEIIGAEFHSAMKITRDHLVRKPNSNSTDSDNRKASFSSDRAHHQASPVQANDVVSRSCTDSGRARWAQSPSLTAGLAFISQSVRDGNGSRSSRSSFKRSPVKWYETHEDDEEEDDEDAVFRRSNAVSVDQDKAGQDAIVSVTDGWNELQEQSKKISIAEAGDIMYEVSLVNHEPQRNEVKNDYSEPEALTISTISCFHSVAQSSFASPKNQLNSTEDHGEDDISQWQKTSSNASFMTKREADPSCCKPSFIQRGHVPIRYQPLRQETLQPQNHDISTRAHDDEPSAASFSKDDDDFSLVKSLHAPASAAISLTVEMDDVGSTIDARQARQKRLADLRQKKLKQLQKAREGAISSRQKQRLGPVSAPATADVDQGSMASTNKSYHPAQAKRPSNRQLIQNALEFTLLAGRSMEKERTAALSALAQSPCDNFLVLLKSAKDMKFRALYQVDRQQHDEVQRIFTVSTTAPQLITSDAIGQFFKYNSGKKAFLPVETRSFTVKTDACSLLERIVLKRHQHLTRLL